MPAASPKCFFHGLLVVAGMHWKCQRQHGLIWLVCICRFGCCLATNNYIVLSIFRIVPNLICWMIRTRTSRFPEVVSRPEAFCRKGLLRNFAKFTGKHLCQSLFFNKVASLRPAILLKKRPWHRCFPVTFVKFLRTPFLKEHL